MFKITWGQKKDVTLTRLYDRCIRRVKPEDARLISFGELFVTYCDKQRGA